MRSQDSASQMKTLGLHRAADDGVDHALWQRVLELPVEQARELGVQALVPGDELVRECQARHQPALLQPIDRTERTAEQDTLHSRKGHEPLGETGLGAHPLHCPVRLLLDRWHGVDRIEDHLLFSRVPDVLLDQERVRLGMDVLHGHLEAIKGTRLWCLDLCSELGGQILQDYPVRSREEREHMLDEMPLAVCKSLPILEVLREIDL